MNRIAFLVALATLVACGDKDDTGAEDTAVEDTAVAE